MSSPSSPPLQRLSRLDWSSPDFEDQLQEILHSQEYVRCETTVGNSDLMWLIDYLDKVRRRITGSHPLLKLV